MDRKGIAVAGTILVDKINEISKYPNAGELTKISRVQMAVGGCVPNVAIDLKVIEPDMEIYAIGKIGSDGDGKFVSSQFEKYHLNTDGVKISENELTSFTNVVSVLGGERTFFTYSGCNSSFGYDDVDLENLNAKILHLGYFLLLDKIDNGDGLKILKKAKELGIKTSIDLVSENSDRYKEVLPALEFTDYLIVNEIEAGGLAGIAPEKNNIKAICEKLIELGVKEKVIIHMPDVGYCYSKDGSYTALPSFQYPKGYIKGTTGAGDAFCAGALNAIYYGKTDLEILEFASSSAATSLSQADAVSGMKNKTSIIEHCKQFKRKELNI